MNYRDYPATRSAAKALGEKYYFTGKPCKHGHISLRKIKGSCVECVKRETEIYAEKRVEYFRAYNKRDDVKDRKNEWYIKNRERVIATANERPIEDKRRYKKTWAERNPEARKADVGQRRRRYRQATPKWLSAKHKNEMRQMYRIAIETSKLSGEQYEVDHIYPIRGKLVSGLHVPWNLRIITKMENGQKNASMPDDSMALAYPDGSGPK